MLNYTATYTDLYQISMAHVYFKKAPQQQAVFEYFFRKLPFQGGYAIFAGLEVLLDTLEKLRFSKEDISYLKTQGFEDDFLAFLKEFRFRGSIRAVPEGEVIFHTAPVLQVEGSLIEAQLVETLLLNILNFETLIATKASRVRTVAKGKTLLDFGLRRAQGPGGYYAARAAMIGGFDGTSNVIAGEDFDIPISGTMAHSFIQSYEDELAAFRDFAHERPHNCVLLIDTYDTLNSGLPNAITVAKEMEEQGQKLLAIRLDSGDLAYLSKRCRKRLDKEGLSYVKIAASNQLDEYVIQSLKVQGAPIDIYGVGTNLVIGKPDGALDGVYKLAVANGKPRIKISESIAKTTFPHKKQVYRMLDEEGMFLGSDAIAQLDEEHVALMHHPYEPYKQLAVGKMKQEALLHPVMENGKRLFPAKKLREIAAFSQSRLAQLPDEYKRFDNPHIYKIGISTKLRDARNELLEHYKKQPL